MNLVPRVIPQRVRNEFERRVKNILTCLKAGDGPNSNDEESRTSALRFVLAKIWELIPFVIDFVDQDFCQRKGQASQMLVTVKHFETLCTSFALGVVAVSPQSLDLHT